jgi:hypothetical protein
MITDDETPPIVATKCTFLRNGASRDFNDNSSPKTHDKGPMIFTNRRGTQYSRSSAI